MTKEELSKLQEECIDYVVSLSVTLNISWFESQFPDPDGYRKNFQNYESSDEYLENSKNKRILCYYEGISEAYIDIDFGLYYPNNFDKEEEDVNKISETINDLDKIFVDISLYPIEKEDWITTTFAIQSLEQFKHIITAIIKI